MQLRWQFAESLYCCKRRIQQLSGEVPYPAKLNNFSSLWSRLDTLAGQIAQMMKIPQFLDFKSGCADIVSYIANIEYINLGEAFK